MHRNSAGFLTIPVAGYAAIGAAVAILGLGALVAVQKSRYEALKAEYEQFKGGVQALGLAAKKAAEAKEAADRRNKEETDALHQAAVDSLNADIRRLHSDSSRGRRLSLPTPATASAAGTCFDAPGFASAIRSLDDGILGIAEVGAKAVVDLDAAKRWAQQR